VVAFAAAASASAAASQLRAATRLQRGSQRADLNQKAAGVVRRLLDRKMQRDEALQLS